MTGQKRSSELLRAGEDAYRAFMRANTATTLGVARAIIDEGGECGVPQGLAAIFGIDPARDYSRLEESAIIVNNNPLGRTALFDKEHKLKTIGVLSDTPLVTRLGYMYTDTNIRNRRFTVAARFNWAMTWEPTLSEKPELLPDHRNPVTILHIQNEEGRIFESSYNLSAEPVGDAASAFNMLAKDDERAPKIVSAFFEELIIRSARPVGEPQPTA